MSCRSPNFPWFKFTMSQRDISAMLELIDPAGPASSMFRKGFPARAPLSLA